MSFGSTRPPIVDEPTVELLSRRYRRRTIERGGPAHRRMQKEWGQPRFDMQKFCTMRHRILKLGLLYSGARAAIALGMRDGKERRMLLHRARKHSDWLGGCGVQHGPAVAAMIRAGIASVLEDRALAEAQLRVAEDGFRRTGMRPAEAVCRARLNGEAGGPWFVEQEIAAPDRLIDSLAPGRWWK